MISKIALPVLTCLLLPGCTTASTNNKTAPVVLTESPLGTFPSTQAEAREIPVSAAFITETGNKNEKSSPTIEMAATAIPVVNENGSGQMLLKGSYRCILPGVTSKVENFSITASAKAGDNLVVRQKDCELPVIVKVNSGYDIISALH
ncbi:hypothetical protein CBJ60_003854 [Salmonella enterica subsp. enterica serovar Ajiobo]|nr:hypothetical protein [Salmonella enterica subsp. enterica serovar Ajiobo]EDN5730285.1 hypothetical protein [Salmonella enterica subsp. enterica serovar Ajiobo]EEE8135615.1 hypothetical protein [Salmonella enterica subsp. enterica serovar Ajiobo]